MGTLKMIAVTALVLVSGTAALAADFATPIVAANTGQTLECALTNVGTKPTNVTLELIDQTGATMPTVFNTCSVGVLQPRGSCVALPSTQPPFAAYCAVTSSTTQVRASIAVFDSSGNTIVVVPVTR